MRYNKNIVRRLSAHRGIGSKISRLQDNMTEQEEIEEAMSTYVLKNIFQTVKEIYLEKTKIGDEELDDLLRHELWLPAEKCLELGLVDKII